MRADDDLPPTVVREFYAVSMLCLGLALLMYLVAVLR